MRNGIVKVSARDKGTGREQQIQLKSSGGLSESEIQAMIKKAEQHASEDKSRKEHIETKNRAEQSVYSTKKSLSDHKDKLTAEQVTSIETAIRECEEALRSADPEELKSKSDALEQASMKIGEAVYKSSGGGGASQSSSGSKEDDKTNDAEYESETPKKK